MTADECYRLKRHGRQVLALEDFTEADIAALEQSTAPQFSRTFDDELKS